jgi:hypothetical protein
MDHAAIQSQLAANVQYGGIAGTLDGHAVTGILGSVSALGSDIDTRTDEWQGMPYTVAVSSFPVGTDPRKLRNAVVSGTRYVVADVRLHPVSALVTFDLVAP